MTEFPNIEALSNEELKLLTVVLAKELVQIKAQMKLVAQLREQRDKEEELKTDLAKLQGKYSPQTLAAAGVPTAEAIGKVGV